VTYLLSPAGQKVWGQQGYRPVLPSVAAQFHFPKPKTLFTIDKFGGWTAVNTRFFDPQTGIVAKDEQSLGVSTASG
jgi:sulfate transport system substrate-binding protein